MTVVVTGEWRGAGAELLSLEIPVVVRADVVIAFDHAAAVLATADMTEEGGASDELTLDVSAEVDGEEADSISLELDPDGDEGVVELSGMTLRAQKAGKTAVRVVVSSGGKSYYSVWKEITVEYAVFDRTDELSLDFLLTDDTLMLDAELILGSGALAVTAVKDVTSDEELLGNSTVLDKTKMKFGVRVYQVETADYAVKISAEVITQKIMNKRDLDEMLTKAAVAGTHDVFDGYVVLGDNIDYGGAEYDFRRGDAERTVTRGTGWKGTFDGRGYTVYNLTVVDMAGIFGYVAKEGVIRNVAFEHINFSPKNNVYGGETSWAVIPFGQFFYGTLENVLITVGNSPNTNSRVIADELGNDQFGNAVLRNVVIDASNFTDNQYAAVVCTYGKAAMSEVSVVTTLSNVTGSNAGTAAVYEDMDTFMQAARDGSFSNIWTKEGERIAFKTFAAFVGKELDKTEEQVTVFNGDKLSVCSFPEMYVEGVLTGGDDKVTYVDGMLSVAEKLSDKTVCTLVLRSKLDPQDSVTVTVTAKVKETPVKDLTVGVDYETYRNTAPLTVTIEDMQGGLVSAQVKSADGSETPVSATGSNNQVVLSGLAQFALGYYVLTVETTEYIYRMPLSILSKIIKTADDFKRVLVYGNTGKDVYGGYVVLGGDIDYAGATYDWNDVKNDTITSDWPTGWTGVFDGRGHTVYNINVKNYCGIFLGIAKGGTIKNVGFANVGLTSGAGTYDSANLLAGFSHGTVENVFVEIASIASNNNQAALYEHHYETAVLRNVVVYVMQAALKNPTETSLNKGILIAATLHEGGVTENVFVVTDFVNISNNVSFETGYKTIKKITGTEALSAEEKAALSKFWTLEYGVPMFASAVRHVTQIAVD